jgi:ligand-binding sensor domain-containing protein
MKKALGLMRFLNNKFSLAPDGDALLKNRIYSAIPLFDNKVMLATKFDGLYIYDGKKIRPLKTQADNYLKEQQIYTGLMLSDSTFAIGTKRGGMVILDLDGNIQSMITDKNGLIMNVVLFMMQDRSGDLWICTDNGISRFEINNPFRVYNDDVGLHGSPNDLIRYNGTLYAATGLGLYKLNTSEYPERFAHFEKIAGINAACWDFVIVDDRLLIATNDGLFEMKGTRLQKIDEEPAFSIHNFKAERNRILVSHDLGLMSMKLRNGSWTKVKGVDNVRLDNIRFSEALEGKVWIGTFSQGATLISFTQPDGSIDYDKPEVKKFWS